MQSYIVNGGERIEGSISSSGSKNSSLPILAATILNKGITKLKNVPNIHDTKIMFEIMELLGCKVVCNENEVIIDSRVINNYEIPDELMRQMRSSVILAGAILSRTKKAIFSYPGGCDIGARPIDLHIKAYKSLGIDIKEENGEILCDSLNMEDGTITLDFPSVGATENIILAATLSNKVVNIKNAAMEPEIVDLQNFINKLGGCVSGAGTNNIKIIGRNEIETNMEYEIMPDRIEIGTLLCSAAITNGNINIKNVKVEHILPVVYKLEEMGCSIKLKDNEINLMAKNKLKACNLKTMPHPGFPTDMQPILSSVLGIAKGTSIIVENIFENRYKYLSELKRMGAKATIEGKAAIIKGIKRYNPAKVEATDLRGGAAMVLAGTVAKGKTTIENIDYILRGYEKFDKKLQAIGVNIRIED